MNPYSIQFHFEWWQIVGPIFVGFMIWKWWSERRDKK